VRALTFNGYLESYVQYLAGEETRSISRLAARLVAEPRLAEPLLVWAAKTHRERRLDRVLGQQERAGLQRELRMLVSLERRGRLESALANEDRQLRPEFSKVWRSYLTRANAPKRDARLKLEARERALALQAAKGVSRYRIARDLGLNPGNLHAFLAQGNTAKLSLARAFELVDYLEAA
jgi:DNA-binding CsgD family transcriptional regulator